MAIYLTQPEEIALRNYLEDVKDVKELPKELRGLKKALEKKWSTACAR